MGVNFFDTGYEETVNIDEFGICDENLVPCSYLGLDVLDKNKWIATIKNDALIELVHTPIDKCLELKRENGEDDNKCDSMIYKKFELILFIELKERRSPGWVSDAMKQLMVTIQHFKNVHPNEYNLFIKREAHIANSLHPKFNSFSSIDKEKFLVATGFRLFGVAEISVEI
jgi:hypothetical protein